MRILVLLALLFVPDRPDPDTKAVRSFQQQLAGEWIVVQCFVEGRSLPDLDGENYIFTAESMQFSKGTQRETVRYVLRDLHTTPIILDFRHPRGDDFDIKGIVKIENNTLTLCYTLGEVRPTEFKSTANEPTYLLRLRRKQ